MIAATFSGGLGDIWATTSLLLRVSETQGKPVAFAGNDLRALALATFFRSNWLLTASLASPTVLFIHPSKYDEYRNLYGTLPRRCVRWKVPFARSYLPTKLPWTGRDNRRVVYHLEPSKPGPRTCPDGHIEMLVTTLESFGYRPVAIGAHAGVDGSLRAASGAALFVGLDSGLSHLCHSVGLPVHLIRNHERVQMIVNAHWGNPYTLHENIPAFLRWFRSSTFMREGVHPTEVRPEGRWLADSRSNGGHDLPD